MKDMQPQIAIPLPTSEDHEYSRLNWNAYASAVREAGGEAVEVSLTLTPQALTRLFNEVDGILLPGSPADVDPACYGHPRDPASAPVDAAREATDRLLLELATATRKPILGVCFGAQMLNVFHGGTLVQDLTILPVNHAAARGVLVAHMVEVSRGSLLASIVEQAGEATEDLCRLPVNSSHHQAIAIPGTGLAVSARCPQDGVIEAVEGVPGHFVLGIQWHPERTTAISATSRALFLRLVEEARMFGDRR